MQKIGLHVFPTHWNITSSTSPHSFFKTSTRQIESKEPFPYIKHYLSKFVQVAFFYARDAENGFKWCLSPWKINSSTVPMTFFKTFRLLVLRAIRQLKITLKRIRPSLFFRCAECRKCICEVFRHLETSLHRLHLSFFKTSRRQIMFLFLSPI
jgi:hypothetical protein